MTDEDLVTTGIAGLDSLLGGGLPPGTAVLVAGPAGSGKTLLGLQFVLHGARVTGEPGAVLLLNEVRETVLRRLDGLVWGPIHPSEPCHLVDLGGLAAGADGPTRSLDFAALVDYLGHAIPRMGLRRVVVDPLNALRPRQPTTLRDDLLAFLAFLRRHDVTTLLLTDAEGRDPPRTPWGIEPALVDGVVHLDLVPDRERLRRALTVRKMRFAPHDLGVHPLTIRPDGLAVHPRDRAPTVLEGGAPAHA